MTTNALLRDQQDPRDVTIRTSEVVLDGVLEVPPRAGGIVVFVHGSGSSRRSPRNRAVARALNRAGLATLLFDLLTLREESDASLRFEIGFLAERLLAVTDAVCADPSLRHLALGYFGASTGAGAALVAAAERGTTVRAVVSRGGRPDLAGAALGRVAAPTLLLVGGHDPVVLDLNREAAARMSCETSLVVIPGATHLFEEPGTLEQVETLACEWFVRYLEVDPADRVVIR